jgi:hypothetical protein
MMIDTGSDINLINKKIFDRLPPLKTNPAIAKFADNSSMLNLMKITTLVKITSVDSEATSTEQQPTFTYRRRHTTTAFLDYLGARRPNQNNYTTNLK